MKKKEPKTLHEVRKWKESVARDTKKIRSAAIVKYFNQPIDHKKKAA